MPFRAAATATGSNNNITIAKPTGVAQGDLLVAVFGIKTADGINSTPAGWTLLDSLLNGGHGCAIYTKIAGSSEPTSYTWTYGSETWDEMGGAIAAYSGIDTTTPVEVYSEFGTTHANFKALSVTTLSSNAILVAIAGTGEWAFANSVTTPPAGYTQRAYVQTGGSGGVLLADKTQATAGASGDATFTPSDLFFVVTYHMALKPAGGGGTPVTVTPAAAIAAATAIAPTVVRGAITRTPAAAVATASALAPVVVRGAVTVTPAPAVAVATALAPLYVRGAVAVAVATAIAPTVVRGAITVIPPPAIAVATAVAPNVGAGLVVTPAPAVAVASASGPVVVRGAVTVTPPPAVAVAAAIPPTVDTGGAVTVTPAPAIAAASAVAPVVIRGAVVVVPAPAVVVASAAGPSVLLGIIVAVVTLHARRNLVLHADRDLGLTSVRNLRLTFERD
jgi:hypothetical protein